jgi:hypothetical protein
LKKKFVVVESKENLGFANCTKTTSKVSKWTTDWSKN